MVEDGDGDGMLQGDQQGGRKQPDKRSLCASGQPGKANSDLYLEYH
jgi:hypothetical protein